MPIESSTYQRILHRLAALSNKAKSMATPGVLEGGPNKAFGPLNVSVKWHRSAAPGGCVRCAAPRQQRSVTTDRPDAPARWMRAVAMLRIMNLTLPAESGVAPWWEAAAVI